MMCRYELPCLYERIRQVMIAEKCSVERAVDIVFAQIAEDPEELQKWWQHMGTLWLRVTEKMVWDGGGPDRLTPRCEDAGAPKAPKRQEPQKPSWRRNVNPLNLVLPVGDTGVKKRLGAFTRADIQVVSAYYQTRGRRLLAEGEKWGEVARRMNEDETLELALDRIAEEDPEGLPEKLKAARAVSSQT